MKNKLFYGWIMMIVTFIGMGLVNYLGVSSFALFVAPVVKTLGVSAAAFLICATMNSLGGMVGAAVGGKLLDSKGLRFTGTAGAILLALGFAGLSQAKSMPVFYVCYLVIGFATSATGSIFINKMVAKWFVKYRGIVTGICTAGQSTMTFVLASFLAKQIEVGGYGRAYFIIAGILVAVALMLALLIRNDPQEMGLLPDGATELNTETKASVEAVGLTAAQAMKTSAFWLIVIGYGINTMASLGVIQTYNAHFQSVGYTAILAAIAASTYGLAGILTRIGWGWIADRIHYRLAWVIGNVLFIASILYLGSVSNAESVAPLYIFGIAYAVGNGFAFVLMVKFIGANFGTKAFGQISGYIMTAMMAGSMVGSPLAGAIYDATGSYSRAYTVFAIAAAAAAIMVLLAKKPEA